MQAVLGEQVLWSDTDHLLALAVDWMSHLDWLVGSIVLKNAPKKPPQPVRRPTDIATAEGETGTRNLEGRETFKGGSLSLEELDRVIAAQTGAPNGIAQEV